jgi:hypothetical protein
LKQGILAMPKPTHRRALTVQDLADIRAALDRAQAFARAHGDDFRLAFRKADRALDRVALAVATQRG